MNTITEGASRTDLSGKQLHALGKELKQKLHDAGCFTPAPLVQTVHMLLVVLLYGSCYTVLLFQPDTVIRLLALLTLAFSSVQAGFVAHEAGHMAITRQRWLQHTIGHFFNTFLTALCYSHFQKIHICHHAHTNERNEDIDMQSDIFSLYPEAKLFKYSWSSRFITRHQGWLIWPLITLHAFSLKIDSLKTLRENPRKTRIDQFVLLMHLLLWFGLPVNMLGMTDALLNYLLMTWFIGPYLGTIFLVNHIGTCVIQPGETMPRFMRQLVTTRNLGDSITADFFFGGLNNHIEHHLFPAIPSVRLRQARTITRAFCRQHGLIYRESGWLKAAAEVTSWLGQIGRQETAGPVRPDPA
jgi:fatty acid desaturase